MIIEKAFKSSLQQNWNLKSEIWTKNADVLHWHVCPSRFSKNER